jgi:hypothetical protein
MPRPASIPKTPPQDNEEVISAATVSPSARPIPSLPIKSLAAPVRSRNSLKGAVRGVDDLQVTEIELPADTTLGCLAWSDPAGTAFFALDRNGVLRKVSYPDLAENWRLELKQQCTWLSPTAEGLLITLPDIQRRFP